MKCCSKYNDVWFVFRHTFRIRQYAKRDTREKAFSLAETVAALLILAFISTSVLVVINRYIASAADSILRMQAFEVTRKSMEDLLASNSVEESVDYGTSETYPDIQWEKAVETFYEPLTATMWVQAVCSAEYTDSEGEVQKVELTHWLANVSKAQMLQILARKQQEEEELLADEIVETLEDAADYAGVDEQTIQKWVKNGMKLTGDGYYIKSQLDLYRDTDGKPTIGYKMQLDEDYDDKQVPLEELPDLGL